MPSYSAFGPVKHKKVSASGTDAAVIAAVTGRKIRVTAYTLTLSAAGTAEFESDGTGDTSLTGAMAMPANGVISGAHNPGGHFDTVSGEALIVTIAGGGTLTGHITYQEVLPGA